MAIRSRDDQVAGYYVRHDHGHERLALNVKVYRGPTAAELQSVAEELGRDSAGVRGDGQSVRGSRAAPG